MNSLEPLFNPRSIALVGASHTEEKLGGVILKNLTRFRGDIYPVNPKYRELMGFASYPSTDDLPDVVDLAVIIRPAMEVPALLSSLKGRAGYAIIVSSGFSETGNNELQEDISAVAVETGIRLLGPNCMGIYNPYKRLDTFFLSYERLKRPKKGNVAVISQSGAILSSFMSAARAANIGLSKAVSIGNGVDIDESDLFEYLESDDKTGVVISYIESVKDGRRFIERAKKLSERKPFIVLKAGKGVKGQAAAYSHTGRLAGRYEVFRSILRQFNIREVHDYDELIDAAKAISYQRPAKGKRVLIVTNAGGCGVLAADECTKYGLDVTSLPAEKGYKLSGIFPDFYGINNPLDLTGQVKNDDYFTVLDELKDDYDGYLIIALSNVLGITAGLADLIIGIRKKTGKPTVFQTDSDGIARELRRRLEKAFIPVYTSPERAVSGIRALLSYS